MAKKYAIGLTEEERSQLLELVTQGKASARKIRRAHVLLLADEGQMDRAIAETLHAGLSTVERTRKKFVQGGLAYALSERPRPGGKRKLDEEQEAFLLSLARSDPPVGYKGWSTQRLADRLVELGVVESISDETVRLVLKKHHVQLRQRRS